MKLLLILILLPLSMVSQEANKDHGDNQGRNIFIVQCGLVGAAGVARAFEQTISFRYDNFKRHFPKANDNYWDVNKSWRNKYKDNDPSHGEKFFLSTRSLVFLTDGKHALDFGAHVPIYIGCCLPLLDSHYCKLPLWRIILRYSILTSINATLFNLTYDIILK